MELVKKPLRNSSEWTSELRTPILPENIPKFRDSGPLPAQKPLTAQGWKTLHKEIEKANTASREFQIVSLKNLFSGNPLAADLLLNQLYDVYKNVFPDPTQRTEKSEIRSVLKDLSEARDILVYVKEGKLLGAVHFTAFNTDFGRTAVAEYVYVNPGERCKGFGQEMFRNFAEILSKRNFSCILAEINDPNLMTRGEIYMDRREGMDPVRRLDYWDKLGFKAISACYSQPPLGGQHQSCDYLMLAVKFLGTTEHSAILYDHYKSMTQGYFSTFTSAEYRKDIITQIDQELRNDYLLKLVPVQEDRQVKRLRGISQ